jgi:hypothetical protein
VVPKEFELHRKIMDEAHCSQYSIHSGTNKMYQDLKKNFWWTRMKRETRQEPATLEYSRVKMGEHLHGLHCGFAPAPRVGITQYGSSWTA